MGNRGNAAKAKKTRRIRKLVLLGAEVLLLLVMVRVLLFVTDITDEDEGIKKVEISTEDIVINEGVDKPGDNNDVLEEEGYFNVALFGLDSTIGELSQGTRSDTIMIASINKSTHEVRLMSVYRDTYLNLGNDTYNKCNLAYAKGSAMQAINMLNMNLDLDIEDFVAVGFKGVMDAVNAVGGIYIDIDEAELEHINNYQICMAENLDTEYVPVTETGYQKVDGLQATAYCRIRHTRGNDFKRTARQREVLQAIMDEAKEMDPKVLTRLAEDVLGNFYTSVDVEDIVALLGGIGSYTIIDEGGFPMDEYLTSATLSKNVGSSVICTDLEAAVSQLHKTLFQEENYRVSDTVKEIGQQIDEDIRPFI